LVVNIEERFPIFGIFEGALFTDIGNVWNWEDWGVDTYADLYPSATNNYTFKPATIIKGMAVDVGLGLRAKISVITLRLDLALPLYDPNYTEEMRWFAKHWSPSVLALNFGINYPF
jgi:outer membrane protein assembly factor BamA